MVGITSLSRQQGSAFMGASPVVHLAASERIASNQAVGATPPNFGRPIPRIGMIRGRHHARDISNSAIEMISPHSHPSKRLSPSSDFMKIHSCLAPVIAGWVSANRDPRSAGPMRDHWKANGTRSPTPRPPSRAARPHGHEVPKPIRKMLRSNEFTEPSPLRSPFVNARTWSP